MELRVKREIRTENVTLGSLFIENRMFCYTLEDKDRGLKDSMTLAEIKLRKIWGKTAIPAGRYKIVLAYSPKFKRVLPVLQNIKGYSGVMVHNGVTEEHTLGCILVGNKRNETRLFDSVFALNALMVVLEKADKNKEDIYITIE